MNWEPQEVSDGKTLEQIYQLRAEVWIAEGSNPASFPDGKLYDTHDTHAFHSIIKQGTQIIAAARFCLHDSIQELPHYDQFNHIKLELPTPVASFNRLLVLQQYRKQGIAKSLYQQRITSTLRLGAKAIIVICNPLLHDMYTSMEFKAVEKVPSPEWEPAHLVENDILVRIL
jgi:predicted GNAT family N-acyltransferase